MASTRKQEIEQQSDPEFPFVGHARPPQASFYVTKVFSAASGPARFQRRSTSTPQK
jgi:hypothetical protein